MTDITLHSTLLNRDIPIRIVEPTYIRPGLHTPIVYLLHGAGESYRNWTNESNIADLASNGILLVMPDGGNTYYINDAANNRYEDFFFTELIPEVHRLYPNAATDRAHTAIAGISRGGYAATLYALKHPTQFSYVAALSSAFDLAERPFRWRSPRQSFEYRSVFGAPNSPTRTANDPHLFASAIDPHQAPTFRLFCGDKDILLPSNQRFADVLQQRHIAHTFEIVHGDHNWGVWSKLIPAIETDLLARFNLQTQASPKP